MHGICSAWASFLVHQNAHGHCDGKGDDDDDDDGDPLTIHSKQQFPRMFLVFLKPACSKSHALLYVSLAPCAPAPIHLFLLASFMFEPPCELIHY